MQANAHVVVGMSLWASDAAALPRVPAAGQAALCAASQVGGAMYLVQSSTGNMTISISGVTITNCSAVAGEDGGVRSRLVAQGGPVGCWGEWGRDEVFVWPAELACACGWHGGYG